MRKIHILFFLLSYVVGYSQSECDTIFRVEFFDNPTTGNIEIIELPYLERTKCLAFDGDLEDLAQIAFDEVVRQSIAVYSDTANFIIFNPVSDQDTFALINNGTESIPIQIRDVGICVNITALSCDTTGIRGQPVDPVDAPTSCFVTSRTLRCEYECGDLTILPEGTVDSGICRVQNPISDKELIVYCDQIRSSIDAINCVPTNNIPVAGTWGMVIMSLGLCIIGLIAIENKPELV